jgi:ketopantoate reductase
MRIRGWGWVWAGLAAVGALAGVVTTQRHLRARQRAKNARALVLVVGAGAVGSAYAARLATHGVRVTVLARGARLEALQTAPTTGRPLPYRVVGALEAEEEYDLVLVAVRAPQTSATLGLLRPLAATTPLLFLQSHLLGAEMMASQLGEERVMLGFPASGAPGLPFGTETTVIGEADGAPTLRLQQTARLLRHVGLRVEVRTDIVPWLQAQSAMLAVLGGCLYRNGGSARRLSADVREVHHYLGTLREAMQVLRARHAVASSREELALLTRPLWVQTLAVRGAMRLPGVTAQMDRFYATHRDEVGALHEQLLSLARRAGVETPLLGALGPFIHEME